MASKGKLQPAWLRSDPVPDSIVPHRVPFPLARCFQQICATASAETLAAEGVKSTKLHPYAALACIQDAAGIDQARLAVMMRNGPRQRRHTDR